MILNLIKLLDQTIHYHKYRDQRNILSYIMGDAFGKIQNMGNYQITWFLEQQQQKLQGERVGRGLLKAI